MVRDEAHLYLKDCIDKVHMTGEVTLDASDVSCLEYAYDALVNDIWHTGMPEAVPHNACRLIIPCVVAVKVNRHKKPLVTVCQRQWNAWSGCWEWSRGLNVIAWRELPEFHS